MEDSFGRDKQWRQTSLRVERPCAPMLFAQSGKARVKPSILANGSLLVKNKERKKAKF